MSTKIQARVQTPSPMPAVQPAAKHKATATAPKKTDSFQASAAKPKPTPTYDGKTPAQGTTGMQQWVPADPPLRGSPNARSADTYTNVINQFAVGSNQRYTPQGDATYCNIFAWDVTSAMGAEIPHWVTPDGRPATQNTPGAYELDADGVNNWLNSNGPNYGWREVSAEEAQKLANEGYPAVVSYNSGDSSPGHIAVVRPGEMNGQGPEIAQAGATNTNDTHVGVTFGDKPVQYFVNDTGTKAPGSAPKSKPSDTKVTAPTAHLHFDGGQTYDPSVEQLQHALVKAGYLSQSDMDTGPGYYGPHTRDAVAKLQAHYGLDGDGTGYGPKTRAALEDALGEKKSGTPKKSGGTTKTSGGTTKSGGKTEPAPKGDGSIRRWNVPYISQMNSAGTADDWNEESNCGPTTMAMIAKGLGYGKSMVDGDLINHFCGVAGVGADGTGYDGIVTMAKSAKLSTSVQQAPTAEWVKQQLEQGNLVAANGNRDVTLANENPPHASGWLTGGHWIAVVGMTKDGNFLVQDPSTTCKELSPQQLERFFQEHGDDGGWAVSIGNGQKGNVTGSEPKSSGAPKTSSVPVPQTDLQFDGGTNYDPNVEQLQHALVKAGYLSQSDMDTGPGYYGPHTKAAVAKLQAQYGIDDDGTHFGPKTRAALTEALGSSAPKSPPKSTPKDPTPAKGTTTVDGVKLSSKDAATAKKVDALLAGYPDSQMHGMGGVLVAACRKERVPLDLVLAQLGKESTFDSDGASVPNNNPGNLRLAGWESQFGGVAGQSGFTRFPSVADGIRAYVHLLGSDTIPSPEHSYRSFVDQRDWAGLVHYYAPSSDGNDEADYAQTLTDWTKYFAGKVGIDSNWVNEK